MYVRESLAISSRPPSLITNQSCFIIAVFWFLAHICALPTLYALGALVAFSYAIHAAPIQLRPISQYTALRCVPHVIRAHGFIGFLSIILVERVRFTADNDFARLLDLVAPRFKADNALALASFHIACVAGEARELVDRSVLRLVGIAVVVAVVVVTLVPCCCRELRRRSEFLGNGCLARLAGCRDGDALDEVGHCHFDVQLDHVGKGVELDVPAHGMLVWHADAKNK